MTAPDGTGTPNRAGTSHRTGTPDEAGTPRKTGTPEGAETLNRAETLDTAETPDTTETGAFDTLMRLAMAGSERFGHREHVHLSWLAVRHFGVSTAIGLISEGIQETARYAGAPQKYHATVTQAWVELVGHHVSESGRGSFEVFLLENPALLDKRLLRRFYRSSTLAEERARRDWVEPDLAPFPFGPS